MSKKPKAPERPLSDRIDKARREGRTQQALELTRALCKYEPTDAHRELLREVTLERGQQLQANGMLRDAAIVFGNLLTMGGSAEFLAVVAQRLAACGAVAPALAAMEQVPDPAVRQRVLQNAVDAAVALGPAGKNSLPAPLHTPFDLILQAFTHYEAGRDEQARDTLQGVGLQSPFIEWKVFLRGLLAYVAKDDARALENWQRLDQTRLPCRLCAAMRSVIDPAYLQSQPAPVQQALRAKMMQQQGLTIAPVLRDLPELLHSDNLAPAFRKAEQVVAVLRRDHPDFLPRFAQCFYWTVVDHGEPDDLTRYLRIFGAPAEDPHAYRLEALALEARGLWPEAHKVWQNFIGEVEKNSAAWPGQSAKRVQALIWTRMAENAGLKRTRRSRSGNPLFDLFAAHTAPLKPSAEQCYENAIKLAPDRLESYRALFELYRADNKIAKAKKLGQELLNRFPDHAETMEALGELCMDSKDYRKAQEYFEKAIQANPLDRSLRKDLARAKQNYGLSLTLAGKHDKAHEQYEQALQLWDGSKTSLLCQWAVAELKANNPDRAQELIAQAQAEPDHRLACRYALVGESVRAKLPAKEKKQIAQDLKTALAQAPTPAEILVLLEGAAHQRDTHVEAFHGQKTQEKTILKFLDGITFDAFNETHLMRLCAGLEALDARKPWFKCLNHARRHFLKNPYFRLSYVDYYLTEHSRDPKTHLAREHLEAAHRLVLEMPRGELQQQYLEQVKECEKVISELNARNPSMRDVMDRFFTDFGPYADEDDDFDDDDDDEFW
jgi:tetratricopeptide (TPR) repeat protein